MSASSISPKEGAEISHPLFAEAATQPGRFPSDFDRTERNFSSVRPTASLQNQTPVSSHIHVHLTWRRLATGPRCHSHSRHVYDGISSSCLGGLSEASVLARQLPARAGTFSNGRVWPLFHDDGLPTRVSAVSSHGLSSEPPRPQPIPRREVSPGQGILTETKQIPCPPVTQAHPTCKAHGNLHPLPNHFHHREVSSHTLTTHKSITPGEFGSRPGFGDPSESVYTTKSTSNTKPHNFTRTPPSVSTSPRHQVPAQPSQARTHARTQVTSRLSPLPHRARHAHGDRDTDGWVHTRTVCGWLHRRQTGRQERTADSAQPLVAGPLPAG